MKIQKFEDIIAWKKSQELAIEIYSVFNKLKDYGFRDQICRATVSISINIAEGFERNSDADFSRFLKIALGSCSEVKSMLYLAFKLEFVDAKVEQNLVEKANEISKIIIGLIKSIN